MSNFPSLQKFKGKYLASGQVGENADVCVWDLGSRKLAYRLNEHDQAVSGLAFTKDELLLATAGLDQRLLVWDMTSGYIVSSSPIKGATGPTIVASGEHVRDIKRRETRDYQLATATGSMLLYWKLDPFEGKLTSEKFGSGHTREYNCITFSQEGDLLYAGSTSGDIAVFSIRNLNLIQKVQVCSLGVQTMYLSQKGYIVACGGDGSISMLQEDNRGSWVVASKTELSKHAITAMSVSSNEAQILTGSENGNIIRLKMDSFNKPILHCENHFGPVLDVRFPSGVNDRFATCSTDNTIRFWDAADYSVYSKATFKKSDAHPLCLTFVRDIIFSGWSDGSIRSIDSETGDVIVNAPNAHRSPISSIVGASNAKFYVTGGEEGSIRVWEIRNQSLVTHFKEHQSTITQLRMFNDDIHVLSASRDKRIFCWDLRKERCISSHMVPMGGVNDVALQSNQSNFISVGSNKMITFWDIRQSKPIRVQEYHQAFEPSCIAVSHNDRTFAVGGTDEVVNLYDTSTGKLLSQGEGHSKPINSLAFSPDDKQLVSCGNDGCVFVWNQFDL